MICEISYIIHKNRAKNLTRDNIDKYGLFLIETWNQNQKPGTRMIFRTIIALFSSLSPKFTYLIGILHRCCLIIAFPTHASTGYFLPQLPCQDMGANGLLKHLPWGLMSSKKAGFSKLKFDGWHKIYIDGGCILYACAHQNLLPYKAGDYIPAVKAFLGLLLCIYILN